MKQLPEVYRRLIEALHDRTRDGSVKWSETFGGTFSVSGDAQTVSLSTREAPASDSDDFEDIYEIEVRDAAGEVVDSYAAAPGDGGYDLIRDLYADARRQARDLRGAVEAFLASIGSAA